MRPLLIQGLRGLGDNVFERPFVKAAAARRPVWLETPWPELWSDVPGLNLAPTPTKLRTQAQNIARQASTTWTVPPLEAEPVRMLYGHEALRRGSIVEALERLLPLDGARFEFDLPDMGPSPVTADRPIAVVRPVTVRSEWRNEARNPRPEYVAELADELRKTHFVVVVAHLAADEEWLLSPAPVGDLNLVAGELDVRQLLALIAAADLVAGGVGWIVPAAIALGTAGFFVLGGQLAHNGPAKITDPRMDLSRVGFARPATPCLCDQMSHACRKTIPDLMTQFRAFRATL